MANQTVAPPLPELSPEVLAFAEEKGVSAYLPAVIEVARRAFPSSRLSVLVDQDAENEDHQYIALDVEVAGLDVEELLASQHAWSSGIFQVCPSRYAVYFVLGWR